jgi:hypothetical protein
VRLGLGGHDVALIVKSYADAASLDPLEFSGHSLRAGFATSAAETGASILKIMETTPHKSVHRSQTRLGTQFRVPHAAMSPSDRWRRVARFR